MNDIIMVIGEFLRRPAATDWKYLSDKAVGGIRAQVGGKLRVLFHRYQPAQGHFASESFLKSWIGLCHFWEISGVGDIIVPAAASALHPSWRPSTPER